MWQDWVFAIGNLCFGLFLIPSIRGKNKPSKWTSLPTALILYLFTYTVWTIDLKLNAITTFISATLWLTLFIQEIRKTNAHESC